MNQYKHIALLLALFISIPLTLNAQNTIIPDRPGIGNGSYTVDPTVVYAEGGIEFFDSEIASTYSFGQLLIRTGLTERVEMRFSLNSYVVRDAVTNTSGFQDIALGVKGDLFQSDFDALTLAGLASLTIPSGASRFTNDEVLPTLGLIADGKISDNWTLSSNFLHTFQFDNLEGTTLLTLTPSVALPNGASSVYFGYAGNYSWEGTEEHFIEFGLTILPSDNLQLDLNSGLDADTNDLFVGAGIAYRF